MNAAFLLVTTAWLAGADAPPAKAAPAPAPAAAACGAGCCGDCAPCCCDEGRPGLLDRLKALCKKKNDCCDSCCQPTCCAPACPAPACKPTCCAPACCDDGCKRERFFTRLCNKFKKDDCCDSCCAPTPCCKPAPVCCKPAPVCCPAPSCNTCCDECKREGLLARFREWCKKKKSCDDCCNSCGSACGGCGGAAPMGPAPERIPAPKEPAKKMPTDEAKPISAIDPAPRTILTVEGEAKNPFELSRRYESRVAHTPDYSSLTGQLFYVHADGGLWVLRYPPLWQEDPNGGSMVLARGITMDSYHEGDLVTVKGEILSPHSSAFLGGPLYRAASIQLVDR